MEGTIRWIREPGDFEILWAIGAIAVGILLTCTVIGGLLVVIPGVIEWHRQFNKRVTLNPEMDKLNNVSKNILSQQSSTIPITSENPNPPSKQITNPINSLQVPESKPVSSQEAERAKAKFKEQLTNLNNEIIAIQAQYNEAEKSKNREARTQLTEQYNAKIEQKINLIVTHIPKGPERFIAMTLPGKIAAGTTFYHSTKSTDQIQNILNQGIRTNTTKSVETNGSNQNANFQKPLLGQGLYVSQAGGYAAEGYTTAFIMETTEDVSTIRIEYRDAFLVKETYKLLELTEEDIQEGLTYLEENYPIIQREGLPPREEEVVIHNPKHHFKPTSITRWNDDEFQWKIDDTATKNLHNSMKNWHKQWKPNAQPSNIYEKTKVIDDQGRCIIHNTNTNKDLFFKPLRGGQTGIVIECEIGASGLANHIMGNLVPASQRLSFDGKNGIAQEAIQFQIKHLPGAVGKHSEKEGYSFDINQLTQSQREQLFAHSLVDWVISNTDVQPHNFAIDKNGNLVAFDKAQAFKFFNGTKVQSTRAMRGIGIESKLNRDNPDFDQLEEDKVIHAHALLRYELKGKNIMINFEAPIIQQTIEKIANLTKEELKGYFVSYARLAFPGQEELFIESIWDRCQDLPRAVNAFRERIQ